jgi:cystinosin
LNILGFWCYTISTASFLYSPTIRSQYAYRHPEAPETTVRFNDFLFAAHGAVMCVIIYSQFFPSLWGFTVGRTQRVSRAVLAIFWALVAGVLIVALLAVFFGESGGSDARYWAWIDVVSAGLIYEVDRGVECRVDSQCRQPSRNVPKRLDGQHKWSLQVNEVLSADTR